MATAEIRARASLDKTGFERGIASMRASAASLKGMIAGAFSVAAITAFAKSAVEYASQFQDIADEIGISASEAQGFSQAIAGAGGSTEKAIAILRSLRKVQEETFDTRTMDEFIASIRDNYKATGDYNQLVKLVGNNAGVFSSVLKSLDGGMKSFSNSTTDASVALADFASEKVSNTLDQLKLKTVELGAGFIEGWKNVIAFFTGGVEGMMKSADEQAREKAAVIKAREERAKQDAINREKLGIEAINAEAMKLEEEAATKKEKNRIKAMSDSERAVELIKETRDMERYMSVLDARRNTTTKEGAEANLEYQKLAVDLAEKQAELADIQSKDEQKPQDMAPEKRRDSLFQIGARALGGTAQKAEKTNDKLLRTADQQLAALQTIARNTGGGARL